MSNPYHTSTREFTIISQYIYLPVNIEYRNPYTEKLIKSNIRKMTYPIRIENGIEGRG